MIRTTPPDRHSRACQQLRLVHPQGPEAGVRTGGAGDWSTADSDALLMDTTIPRPLLKFYPGDIGSMLIPSMTDWEAGRLSPLELNLRVTSWGCRVTSTGVASVAAEIDRVVD